MEALLNLSAVCATVVLPVVLASRQNLETSYRGPNLINFVVENV